MVIAGGGRAPRLVPELHKYTARITALFCIPEQGMVSHEILSRATAFPTLNKSDEIAFFTSGHVVAPWLYPQYYEGSMQWLKFINHAHCSYILEMQDKDPAKSRCYVLNKVHLHPKRDVAMLHFFDDRAARKNMRSNGIELEPLSLRSNERLGQGEKCSIVGYIGEYTEEEAARIATSRGRFDPNDTSPEYEDWPIKFHFAHHKLGERLLQMRGGGPSAWSSNVDKKASLVNGEALRLFPFYVDGTGSVRTKHQAFIGTNDVVHHGMCGAPVIDTSNNCVGIVDGIVPLNASEAKGNPGLKMIEGHASLIDADTLNEFMENPPPCVDIGFGDMPTP